MNGMSDLFSHENLCNCTVGLNRESGFTANQSDDLCVTHVMLCQLSYQAMIFTLETGQFVASICQHMELMNKYLHMICFIY